MKAREARRNQAHTVMKEMRLRLKIDPHDYEHEEGPCRAVPQGGDKVKVMIMFRGREQSRPEMGYRLLQRMAADVADLGYVESNPKQDGRNMIMVIGPHKKKAEAKAEQRKHRPDEVEAEDAATPRRRSGRRAERDRPGLTAGNEGRRPPSRAAARTAPPRGERGGDEESTAAMPKNKTHSGAKKRFKITGTGKVLRQQTGLRHRLEVKSSRETRALSEDAPVSPADAKKAKRLLGLELTHPSPRSTEPRRHHVARVKRAVNAQKKRRSVLEAASGYRGQRSRLYRKAKEQVTHSLLYSYRDRKAARATSASCGSSGSTPRPAPTA